jgi:hypothetical protein
MSSSGADEARSQPKDGLTWAALKKAARACRRPASPGGRYGSISAAEHKARRRRVLLSKRTPKSRLSEEFRVDRQKRPRRKPAGALFRRDRHLSIPLFSDFRSSVKLRPWPRSRQGGSKDSVPRSRSFHGAQAQSSSSTSSSASDPVTRTLEQDSPRAPAARPARRSSSGGTLGRKGKP